MSGKSFIDVIIEIVYVCVTMYHVLCNHVSLHVYSIVTWVTVKLTFFGSVGKCWRSYRTLLTDDFRHRSQILDGQFIVSQNGQAK